MGGMLRLPAPSSLTHSFGEPQHSGLGFSRAYLVLWVKTSCLPEKEGGLGWGARSRLPTPYLPLSVCWGELSSLRKALFQV